MIRIELPRNLSADGVVVGLESSLDLAVWRDATGVGDPVIQRDGAGQARIVWRVAPSSAPGHPPEFFRIALRPSDG
jgi:hypothetical protein